MTPLIEALDQSALATLMRTALYPYVRALHFIGAALTVGSIVLFDLRVLGVGRAMRQADVRALTLRWVWTGFAIAVGAGLLLFLAQPAALSENGALRIKLAMLGFAGINALAFERVAARPIPAPGLEKGFATMSLLLWLGILLFSSLIPYWGF